MRRTAVLSLCLGVLSAAAALAQQPDIVLSAAPKQLTPHVWAIFGNPNIAIVVGSTGTLVIDTGLGNRNGAFIAGEAAKLRKGGKLFLTTTHVHAEHASGQGGFPAETVVIRPKAQQHEMDEFGMASIEGFRSRSEINRELLTGARAGKSDVQFDDEMTLDLGDVRARLMWFGPAHSNGDMLTLVEGDNVLVSGDVVQNKVSFGLSGSQTSFASWFAVLDKVEKLKPALILPDHSAPGDGSLIGEQRAFMTDLLERARSLKKEGKSAEEAGRIISAEFQAKYKGWTRMMFVPGAVAKAFDEVR